MKTKKVNPEDSTHFQFVMTNPRTGEVFKGPVTAWPNALEAAKNCFPQTEEELAQRILAEVQNGIWNVLVAFPEWPESPLLFFRTAPVYQGEAAMEISEIGAETAETSSDAEMHKWKSSCIETIG